MSNNDIWAWMDRKEEHFDDPEGKTPEEIEAIYASAEGHKEELEAKASPGDKLVRLVRRDMDVIQYGFSPVLPKRLDEGDQTTIGENYYTLVSSVETATGDWELTWKMNYSDELMVTSVNSDEPVGIVSDSFGWFITSGWYQAPFPELVCWVDEEKARIDLLKEEDERRATVKASQERHGSNVIQVDFAGRSVPEDDDLDLFDDDDFDDEPPF